MELALIFPDLRPYADWPLLLARIAAGVVFFSSGLNHMKQPKERGKSIGMPTSATFVLGAWELLGAISVILGIFAQIGAAMLIVSMLGAISKKVFVWKTGFFASEGMGWHYDLLLLSINAIVLFLGGGRWVLVAG